MNHEIDEQLGYLRQHRPSDENPVVVALESVAYGLALIARELNEANAIADERQASEKENNYP